MARTHALSGRVRASPCFSPRAAEGAAATTAAAAAAGARRPHRPPTARTPARRRCWPTRPIGLPHRRPGAPSKKTLIDGNPRGRRFEAAALHRWAEERRRNEQSGPASRRRASANRNPPSSRRRRSRKTSARSPSSRTPAISILPQNPYDVRSTGLRFTRSGSSYTLSKIDGTFRTALGTRLTLTDDDSAATTIPFSFPSTARADRRVRELRRQHHLRGRGQREHRAERRPHGHRPAARVAVLRRPRSDDGHRAGSSSTPRPTSTP